MNNLKWNTCKSLEELKSLGPFNKVREIVKNESDGCIKATSWDILFKKIQTLKNLFSSITPTENGFISEADEYIFCLVNLDGENRMRVLGANQLHYLDPDKAKQWKSKIFQKIHPDKCNNSRANEAVNTLNKIYEGMIRK